MQTVHPVIVFGSYQLDLERLPPDEFQMRLRAVQAAIKSKGWSGIIANGNPEGSALVTYVSNYSPRSRSALLLIPTEGNPRLLLWASMRDLRREAAMTWIEDVKLSGKVDETVAAWCTDAKIDGGTIGIFDIGNMRPPLYAALHRALDARGLKAADADADMFALMHAKRPREMVMMRRAAEILGDAVKALKDKWQSGSTAGEALLAAEGAGFGGTAQDVRTLISVDGGRTLRPLTGGGVTRPDRLVAYIALRYQGYWVEAFVTLAGPGHDVDKAATEALSALVKAARPGATGRDLAAAAGQNKFQAHSVLGGSLGHSIGLALDEQPKFTATSSDAMRLGGTYSLTVGLADADGAGSFASAVIALTETGTDVLWRS